MSNFPDYSSLLATLLVSHNPIGCHGNFTMDVSSIGYGFHSKTFDQLKNKNV